MQPFHAIPDTDPPDFEAVFQTLAILHVRSDYILCHQIGARHASVQQQDNQTGAALQGIARSLTLCTASDAWGTKLWLDWLL